MELDTVYFDSPNERYVFIFKHGTKETAWYITNEILISDPKYAANSLRQILEWYKNNGS